MLIVLCMYITVQYICTLTQLLYTCTTVLFDSCMIVELCLTWFVIADSMVGSVVNRKQQEIFVQACTQHVFFLKKPTTKKKIPYSINHNQNYFIYWLFEMCENRSNFY